MAGISAKSGLAEKGWMRWDGSMIPIEQPPPLPPPGWQDAKRDAEHIKLLSIFHYVFAGLSVVGGLFFALYIVFAVFMMRSFAGAAAAGGPPGSAPPQAMMEMMGMAYAVMGVVGGLVSLGMGVGSFLAAKGLAERRRRTLIYVVSAFQCLCMPLGTALGIFTIIVLERASVRLLFQGRDEGGAAG